MLCSCFHLYEYAYVTTVNYVLSQIQLTSKSLSENRGMKGISYAGSLSARTRLGRPETSIRRASVNNESRSPDQGW